jgi:hypothetical protein
VSRSYFADFGGRRINRVDVRGWSSLPKESSVNDPIFETSSHNQLTGFRRPADIKLSIVCSSPRASVMLSNN